MVPAVRSEVVGAVIQALLESGAHSATKILEPNLVVRATRPVEREMRWVPARGKNRKKVWGKVKLNGAGKRATRIEAHVTIGVPNHETREFIKSLERADEPFPVKKIWLRFLPKQ